MAVAEASADDNAFSRWADLHLDLGVADPADVAARVAARANTSNAPSRFRADLWRLAARLGARVDVRAMIEDYRKPGLAP